MIASLFLLCRSANIGILWPSTESNLTKVVLAAIAEAPHGSNAVNLTFRDNGTAFLEDEIDRMLAIGDLIGFIGPSTSGEALVAAHAGARMHLPVLSPSATATALDGIPYFRRLIPSDRYQGEVAVSFIAALGFRRVAVIYDSSTTYGAGLFTQLVRALQVAKISLVHSISAIPQDVDEAVRSLSAMWLGAWVIILLGHREFALSVLDSARAQSPQLFGTNIAWLTSESLAVRSTPSEQQALQALHGLLAIRVYPPQFNMPYTRVFQALGRAPTLFELYAYDCTLTLLRAANAAQVLDKGYTRRFAQASPWEHGGAVLDEIDAQSGHIGASGAHRAASENPPFELVNLQGRHWVRVGSMSASGEATVFHKLIRWPNVHGTPLVDPASLPITERLSGRTLIIGDYGQDASLVRVGYLAFRSSLVEYLVAKGKFNVVTLPLPCRMSLCSNADPHLDIPDSWDEYYCTYYGTDPNHTALRASLSLRQFHMWDHDALVSVTPHRTACGVHYSTPVLAYRYRLIAKRVTEKPFRLDAFLDPFTPGLWAVMCASVAFIVLFLSLAEEYTDVVQAGRGSKERRWGRLWQFCRQFSGSVVGASQTRPRARTGRALLALWHIFLFVMTSVYAANIAVFFAVKRLTPNAIGSVHDLIDQKQRLCINKKQVLHESTLYKFVVKNYPELLLYEVELGERVTTDNTFLFLEAINGTRCVAVIDYDFKLAHDLANNLNYPEFCQLQLVGPPMGATFFKAAVFGPQMDSYDVEAFNYWSSLWVHSGRARRAENAFFYRSPDVPCVEEDTESEQLGLKQMAGVFVLLFVSFFLTTVTGRVWRIMAKAQQRKQNEAKAGEKQNTMAQCSVEQGYLEPEVITPEDVSMVESTKCKGEPMPMPSDTAGESMLMPSDNAGEPMQAE